MLYVVIIFFLISIFIYCLLGGADFGAGIIELTASKKTREITRAVVTEAMAPIWEANHMWLVIAVVILFNGFPDIYSQLLISLSIPLILMLVGIIFRGAAFTFRHYDAIKDSSQEIYSKVFEYSSVIVPFFFGLVIGSLVYGKITTAPTSFYEGYIEPWFNLFSIATGIFIVSLFAYVASVFLISELKDKHVTNEFVAKSRRSLIYVVLSGSLVFVSSLIDHVHFAERFFNSDISIIFMVLATATLPFTWKIIGLSSKWFSRITVGAQLFFILGAFYVVYFPSLVLLKNGNAFTFFNSSAPYETLKYLAFALIFGSVIIFPSLFYLFNVFKAEKKVTGRDDEIIQ